MPRLFLNVLLVVGALVSGGFGVRYVRDRRQEPAPAPVHRLADVPVDVVVLERRDVAVTVRGYGNLLPLRTAQIAPEVAGRLVHVAAEWRDGARVAEGTLLLAVDREPFALEVERAGAGVGRAQADLNRARHEAAQSMAARALAATRLATLAREEARWIELEASGRAAASQVDRIRSDRLSAAITAQEAEAREGRAPIDVAVAEALVRDAESLLALAEDRLRRAEVRAPFAGRLVGRAPGIGSPLAAAEPLAELVDVSVLALSVRLPAGEAALVGVGRPATVSIPSRPELEVEGVVGSVGAQADPATRTVAVELDVPQPSGPDEARPVAPLFVGLFAEALIDVDTLAGVLVVDRAHVVSGAGGAKVFVVREEPGGTLVAEARPVTLGRAVGEGSVIKSGVTAGERLIIRPLRQLTDGAPIVIRVESAER